MNTELLQTIIITGAILVVFVPMLRLMKHGKIEGMFLGKDGIKVDMRSVDERAKTQHFLNKSIREIDEQLEYDTYKVTVNYGKKILRVITRRTDCVPSGYTVASEMKSVLYQTLRENSFKERLTKANRDEYIETKLNKMYQVYDDISWSLSKEPCKGTGKEVALGGYDAIRDEIEVIVDGWADEIRNLVIKACTDKIEKYTEYREHFVKANDTYFVTVIDECIAKNKRYIQELQ